MKIQTSPYRKGFIIVERFGDGNAIETDFKNKKVIESIYQNGILTRKKVKKA